ncbi:unnamed protein product (macronuclear) [Paramecium tetraurelia]|uniref:G domain-containing protein n=1 Tax=Paramecium tetraurelia TaxID=5888 RepID=A0CPZ9_PARTE|nr:uncharacterized protein GSPATT00038823001 [Paramecium tetraurelia]CAK72866.1 unnamed protein product [Paramecium tetraurelia]|eukprot:XP_001440263.1 hypothetical protein (macronuclear) [Paramecium tetraurelia strain d4-2]
MSIVLLGQIGSGKTTLYNKITLSQEKIKAGGNSVTMSVFMKKSCYGQGFSILDTPGFGSESKKLDHIAGVLSALSEGPINRIVFIVRFTRTNVIMEDVKKILPAFIKYRHMITVIVTCWDFCEKSEEEKNKNDIQSRLASFKINSAMFVGLNDTPDSICEQIDQIIATSKAENINLTENDIFSNFDMTDYDEGEIFEIELLKGESTSYYHIFFEQAMFKIEVNNIPNGLQADYFYAITQFAKKTVDDTMKKFETQSIDIIDKLKQKDQLKAFQIHFQLKSILFKEYEYIVEAAHKKMNAGNHFSKYIRKCYYCGEIWFKAAGCEGNTVCGRLNENHLDDFIKQEQAPQKFIVTYDREKLEIKVDESVKPKVVVLNEKNKQSLMTDVTKIKIEEMKLDNETFRVGGAGCKKVIDWSKMSPLTEYEMNQILGILDIKMCEKMVEFEKLTLEKTKKQQSQYKNELDQKIKLQKLNMQKAA